jgi:hypothetical protein
MKLNLKTMFTLDGIFLIFTSVLAFLSNIVPAIQTAYGVNDLSTYYAFLIVGTSQLMLGLVAVLVSKNPASPTLTTLAYG